MLLAIGLATCSAVLVSPTESETRACRDWAARAFFGIEPADEPTAPGLYVRRQTNGTLRINSSALGTPLRPGGHSCKRGLGTHSVSEIVVRLAEPARRFLAIVGIDDNPDTRRGSPSVEFVVAAAGHELWRSSVMTLGSAPARVDVSLAAARELTLSVTDAGDGPGWDQADWGDACVELEDGSTLYLDALPVASGPTRAVEALPFSFSYGDRPWAEQRGTWRRETHLAEDGGQVSFIDPASGLSVTAHVRVFDDFPAVEWMLEFANEGDSDSAAIGDVRALDLTLTTPPGEACTVRHTRGSTCELTDFIPMDEALPPGKEVRLAPVGGRSSNGTLPFFNLEWGTGGLVTAIGWSGQWAAEVTRPDAEVLRVTGGMQDLATSLRPGERIRSPRILLLLWNGADAARGRNLFRRLMVEHYCPRDERGPVQPPVAHPTSWAVLSSGEAANETNQLEMLQAAHDIGAEAYWLDAYWFPVGFPGGVGNWFPRPEDFPRGLRPLGDAAHERGMRFILWFEPERVARGSAIATEHPAYCLEAGPGDLLYDLGHPGALKHMSGLLSDVIERSGVDVYREDFNIDPLPFWRAADAPGRRGMTEMRFVEGLYALWDSLRERHPGLLIDNCASGGRRIDLETVSRSYALWRSDFQDIGILSYPDYPWIAAIASQVQNVGLGMYVPMHSCGVYDFSPYSVYSATSGGLNPYIDLRDPSIDRNLARSAVAAVKELRPYFLGDLYPLLPVTVSASDWCGYQLNRPDDGDGIALFFRRHESPYLAVAAGLHEIDAGARYAFAVIHEYSAPEWRECGGAELAAVTVGIDTAPGVALLRYRRLP